MHMLGDEMMHCPPVSWRVSVSTQASKHETLQQTQDASTTPEPNSPEFNP